MKRLFLIAAALTIATTPALADSNKGRNASGYVLLLSAQKNNPSDSTIASAKVTIKASTGKIIDFGTVAFANLSASITYNGCRIKMALHDDKEGLEDGWSVTAPPTCTALPKAARGTYKYF